jgi:type III secretory pathway component EscS
MISTVTWQVVLLVALFSGIPLLVSVVCGLVVAIIQTVTQIQEQSVTYVVKFIAVSVTFLFIGPWMVHEVTEFFRNSLGSIAYVDTATGK